MVIAYIRSRTKSFVYEIVIGNDYRYEANNGIDEHMSGTLVLPINSLGIYFQRDDGSLSRLRASNFVLTLNLEKKEIRIPKIHFEPVLESDVDDKMMESTLYAYDKRTGIFGDTRRSKTTECVVESSSENSSICKSIWKQFKDSMSGWINFGSDETENQPKTFSSDLEEQISTISAKINEIIGSPKIIIEDFSLSHSVNDRSVAIIITAAPLEFLFEPKSDSVIGDIENISVKINKTKNLFSTNIKKLRFGSNLSKKNIEVNLRGVYITTSCLLSEIFELVEEFLCQFYFSKKEKTRLCLDMEDIGIGFKIEKSYLMLKSKKLKIVDNWYWSNEFIISFKQYGRNNLEQTRKLDIMSIQEISYLNEHLRITNVDFNLYGDLYNRLKSFVEPLIEEINIIQHLIRKTCQIMSFDHNTRDNNRDNNREEPLFNMDDITGAIITHKNYPNQTELCFDDNYFDLENSITSYKVPDETGFRISCNIVKLYQWINDWDKSINNYVVWKLEGIECSYLESVKIYWNIKNWIIEDHLQNSNWKTFLHSIDRKNCSLILNAFYVGDKEKWNLNIFLDDLVLNIDEDTFNFMVQNICSQIGSRWIEKYNDSEFDSEFDSLGVDYCNDWDALKEYDKDRERIDYENNGFEFVNKNSGFISQVELNSFTLILSYRPKYINYGNLISGKVSELFKLKNIRDLPLRFSNHIIIDDVSFNTVLMSWLEDILNLNMNRIIFSGGSFDVLYNIAVNMLNIIKMKKGNRGTIKNLGKMATRDFLNLTSRSILKVQLILEKFTRKKSAVGSNRSGFSESPSSMKEGFHGGWTSLRDRCSYMTSEEVSIKSIIMQPFIGATEMISKTLIGLENQLDANRKKWRDKRYE